LVVPFSARAFSLAVVVLVTAAAPAALLIGASHYIERSDRPVWLELILDWTGKEPMGLLYGLEPIATAGLILIVFGVALLLACAFARVLGRQRSI
jgi:hypothetical protein